MRWMKIAMDILVGCGVLGFGYFCLYKITLAFFSTPGVFYAMMFGEYFLVTGIFTLIWLAFLYAMVSFGSSRDRPGYAAAPFIFCTVWFATSVAERASLAREHPSTSIDDSTLAEARSLKTVIVGNSDIVKSEAVTNGTLKSIVSVSPSLFASEKISIRETYLEHGSKCANDSPSAFNAAYENGVMDQCLKSRTLTAIPNGLELKIRSDQSVSNLGTGCCSTVDVIRRTGGDEKNLFSWSKGRALVLSYFPAFGFPWFGGGLWTTTSYGDSDIQAEVVLKTIYGDDFNKAPKPPSLDEKEWERRIEYFAKTSEYATRTMAAQLAVTAIEQGVVTTKIIQAVVDTIGLEPQSDPNINIFFRLLNSDQKREFAERSLIRLTSPNICGICKDTRFTYWLGNEEPEDIQNQSLEAFEQHHDLASWQYESLLYLAGENNIKGPNKERIFQAILSDKAAFSQRILAFAHVYLYFSDLELEEIGACLDQVAKEDRQAFIRDVHPNRDLSIFPKNSATISDRFNKAVSVQMH